MNKKIYIIIGLLVAATLSVASIPFFTFGQKEENKTDNKEENSTNIIEENKPSLKEDEQINTKKPENSVKLNSISLESDKIVQKFDIALNGKNEIFEIEYSTQKNDKDYCAHILGKIPGSKKEFSVASTNENIDSFLSKNFTKRKVRDYVTENDFKFLKGEDNKTYILFVFRTTSKHFTGDADYLYIYNENLQLVTGDVDYNGCDNDEAFTIRTGASGNFSDEEPGKSGYIDTENYLGYRNVKDSYLNLKIEGNKIYYLKALQNFLNDDNFGILEERVYTIKDDKLDYTVKNKFVLKYVLGEVC